MNVRILSCAEQEFVEVVDYYNEQRHGLGIEFVAEVKIRLSVSYPFPMRGLFYQAEQGVALPIDFRMAYYIRCGMT